MRRDLKIGMLAGSAVVVCVMIWFSARSDFSAGLHFRPEQLDVPEIKTQARPERPKYPEPKRIKTTRFHVVRKGQTLCDIAEKYYGSRAKWQKIADANPTTGTDPDRVKAGTKLTIPD